MKASREVKRFRSSTLRSFVNPRFMTDGLTPERNGHCIDYVLYTLPQS